MPRARIPISTFNHPLLKQWDSECTKPREQVCYEADVSFPYLSRLIREGGNPSAALLARLAQAYGHDLRELFNEDDAA